MEQLVKKLRVQLNKNRSMFSNYRKTTINKIQQLEQEKLSMTKKHIRELKVLNRRLINTEKKLTRMIRTETDIQKIKSENMLLKSELNELQGTAQNLKELINEILGDKTESKSIECPICRTKNKHNIIGEVYGLEQKCCVCMDNIVNIFLPTCKHACLCIDCYNHMVVTSNVPNIANIPPNLPNIGSVVILGARPEDDIEVGYEDAEYNDYIQNNEYIEYDEYLENYPMQDAEEVEYFY